MMPEQQQRILGYFIEEAKDHLNTIEQGLLNLQATIEDPEMVNEVFRAAHSVKGGAAMLGIGSVQRTSHRLEDFFKVLKESPSTQVDRNLESMFLQLFDGLQALVEELQGPFGLTDDKAQEVMTDLEPVFEQLDKHLNALLDGAAPPAVAQVPVAAAAPKRKVQKAVQTSEASALNLVFKSDVPGHLREMLTLFKQADTDANRMALQTCCEALMRIGEQFDLHSWCALTLSARQATGNPEQTFRTLAPIIIKDLKKAQELVLSGQADEVVISAELAALVPVVDEPATMDEEIDTLLDDALAADEEPDLVDLFESNTEPAAADLAWEASTPTAEASLATAADDDFAGAFESFSATAPESTASMPGREPSVGVAELNSLADLFEGEVSELDSPWEEVSETEGSRSDSQGPDINISNDFSDLLEDSLGDDGIADTEQDLADLFGSNSLDSDFAAMDPLETAAQDRDTEAQSDGDFADLFDLSGETSPALSTPTENGDLDDLLNSVSEAAVTSEEDIGDRDLDIETAADLDNALPDFGDLFDAEAAADLDLDQQATSEEEILDFAEIPDQPEIAGAVDALFEPAVEPPAPAAEPLAAAAPEPEPQTEATFTFEVIEDPWTAVTVIEEEDSEEAALDALDELWSESHQEEAAAAVPQGGEEAPATAASATSPEDDFADFDALDLDADSATSADSAADLGDLFDSPEETEDFSGMFDEPLEDLTESAAEAEAEAEAAIAAADTDLEDFFATDLGTPSSTSESDDLEDELADLMQADLTTPETSLELDSEDELAAWGTENAATPTDDTGELDFASFDDLMSDNESDDATTAEADTDDLDLGNDLDALMQAGAATPDTDIDDDIDAAASAGLDDLTQDTDATVDDTDDLDLGNDLDALMQAGAATPETDTSELDLASFDELMADPSPASATADDDLDLGNDLDALMQGEEAAAAADDELGLADFDNLMSDSDATSAATADDLDLDGEFDALMQADETSLEAPEEAIALDSADTFWADVDAPDEAADASENLFDALSSSDFDDSIFASELDEGLAALDAEPSLELDDPEAEDLSDFGELFEESSDSEAATSASADLDLEGPTDFDLAFAEADTAAIATPAATGGAEETGDFSDDAIQAGLLGSTDDSPDPDTDWFSAEPQALVNQPDDPLASDDLAFDLDDELSFDEPDLANLAEENETESDFDALFETAPEDEAAPDTADALDDGLDLDLDLQGPPSEADQDLDDLFLDATDADDSDNFLDATGLDLETEAFDPITLAEAPPTIDGDLTDDEVASNDDLADLDELDALLSDEDPDTSEADPSFDELDNLLADEPSDEDEADFDELEALLEDEPEAEAEMTSAAGAVDFDELEALLEDESVDSSPEAAIAAQEPDEFSDLEKLLEEADQTLGGGSPSMRTTSGGRPSRRVGAMVDQTMRVSVKHLDNLNNLVGELVVNRNSLEQDQERLRQFLDNLMFQVQQLNDVGQRMRDLYERSLLESSLISSRQAFQGTGIGRGGNGHGGNGGSSHATGATFDALEMDRFTGFHTLSQEMIELIVRVRESASDIAYTVESSDQITRQFRQVTTQLQEGLNKARMVPFAQTADRLPRAVRDISLKCGKEARLVVEGRDTLIDKMILERLYDPMTHLVNNAITHGIETPDERAAVGKPREGSITVRAFYQGNQTVIYIADDGGGINPDIVKRKAIKKGLITQAEADAMTTLETYELLFRPGFSTRDKADDFAGRGVGMDVVRTALSDIRGSITIDSEMGRGTSFTIRLPLTLSISKALSCLNNHASIAFPMDGVEDMFDVPKERVNVDPENHMTIQWRDNTLHFQPLSELLQFNRSLGRGRVYGGSQDDDMVSIVVLRNANTYIGVQVDRVLGEQEIVIKQIEGPVPKPMGIAGATVLGDGRVMPIADVLELIDIAQGRVRREAGSSLWSQSAEPPEAETVAIKAEPTVLIVDDSITVRELLSMSFNKVGYRVEQARDGQEAWEKLRSGLPCDLVFCDIEMPRMDGLELLSRMQKDGMLKRVPIAMLTSRGADRHRQMALDLGASGYFTKPYLEEALLDAAQRMLNGEVLLTKAAVEED